jgi:hypothetical protein
MNLTLWITAGLLSAVFLVAAISKLTASKEELAAAPGGAWVHDFSPGTVRAVGTLDLLGAVGLILPAAFDVAPVLVPLAGLGLVLLMVGAVITRVRHGGAQAIALDLTYLVLAGFVAWGRLGPEPLGG